MSLASCIRSSLKTTSECERRLGAVQVNTFAGMVFSSALRVTIAHACPKILWPLAGSMRAGCRNSIGIFEPWSWSSLTLPPSRGLGFFKRRCADWVGNHLLEQQSSEQIVFPRRSVVLVRLNKRTFISPVCVCLGGAYSCHRFVY